MLCLWPFSTDLFLGFIAKGVTNFGVHFKIGGSTYLFILYSYSKQPRKLYCTNVAPIPLDWKDRHFVYMGGGFQVLIEHLLWTYRGGWTVPKAEERDIFRACQSLARVRDPSFIVAWTTATAIMPRSRVLPCLRCVRATLGRYVWWYDLVD